MRVGLCMCLCLCRCLCRTLQWIYLFCLLFYLVLMLMSLVKTRLDRARIPDLIFLCERCSQKCERGSQVVYAVFIAGTKIEDAMNQTRD